MIGIILAAGRGKRMNSYLPKVLHKINNKMMIERIIINMIKSDINKIYIIVSNNNYEIIKTHLLHYTKLEYVIQEEALGTGHALICFFNKVNIQNENLIICCGDMPLLNNYLFENMKKKSPFGICAFYKENPKGYGRIILDDLIKIIEEKDCNEKEKKINICNSGIYILPSNELKFVLSFLNNDNNQNEYYLTDTIKLIQEKFNLKCSVFILKETESILVEGVNSKTDLDYINTIFQPEFIKLKKEYLHMIPNVLSQLTDCEYNELNFIKQFEEIEKNKNIHTYIAYHKLIGVYGIGSLYIMPKFIHDCKNVGQIEDIVIDKNLHNEGLGKLLINFLIEIAKQNNCYKVILNSKKKNEKFYEKLGFISNQCQFEIRF